MKAVLDENEGEVNYETIHQMTYLEAAIEENLRLYSPVIRLEEKHKLHNDHETYVFAT